MFGFRSRRNKRNEIALEPLNVRLLVGGKVVEKSLPLAEAVEQLKPYCNDFDELIVFGMQDIIVTDKSGARNVISVSII